MSDTQQPVYLCAIIRAKDGAEAELRALLTEVVLATQAEPGCHQFQIHEIEGSPGEFMLWEHFSSQDSLREHIGKDYTKTYFTKANPLMSQSTQVIRLNKLA
jgi:quinol monooxygenase YgiN